MVRFLWLLAVSWKGLYFIKAYNRRLCGFPSPYSQNYLKEQSFSFHKHLKFKTVAFLSKNCTIALTFIMVLTKNTKCDQLCSVSVH